MNIYIGEIAGKDSVAALHTFIKKNNSHRIIPTIVKTSTEYGDFESYYKSIDYISNFAQNFGTKVDLPFIIHDEKLWNILCIKYQHQIQKKYGFYTPCIMCHLFTHLIRIPVFLNYNAKGIITGERISHNGVIKVNQDKITLEYFNFLFNQYGISLIQPLINIANTSFVEKEIYDYPNMEHINDVKCILSGNLNGVLFKNKQMMYMLKQFLEEYVLAVGDYILRCFVNEKMIDYEQLTKIIERIFYNG